MKKRFLLFINVFIILVSSVNYCTDWTALIFVQANNNLKNFAQRNFADMASVGSTPDINILVQCHFPHCPGAYRYKIEKEKMELDEHIEEESDGTTSKDLIGAFNWAVTKYPAKKYALILWNHGVGILDPVWGKIHPWQSPQKFYIEEEMLSTNPRTRIDNLTFDNTFTNTCLNIQTMADNEISIEEKFITSSGYRSTQNTDPKRGILFNEQSRTYMTNQAFITALKEIQKNVLQGKKIDLLGMDACLMAMIEVGFQSRAYAKYLVASEESELAHGWDYSSLCKMLGEKLSPENVAMGIVSNYELFYKNKINFYTLSAIDLSWMDELKSNLDAMINILENYMLIDKSSITTSIKKARTACQQFSVPNYVDLHSFLTEFLNQITSNTVLNTKNTTFYQSLRNSIQKNIDSLKQAIILSTAGKSLARAQGLSIYFPIHQIDKSYMQTEFAEASRWTSFIKKILTSNG